ncbi:hypothetical protein Pla52o_10480 [Novipirellula galeiformis]|uniref:Class I SAM-dependent methyltransferase n=1 Tax=Novipirellula galeiformis TaxID=2528004 RepID=A0A5C6CU55_9BACT|nr:class I SAM-dependent methyltransferase [Novipirellula galeiformis]TWU27184.1 hypothetical protein Pla52o_10480 [Novipirellula galeiformis]
MMNKALKTIFKALPGVRRIVADRDRLREDVLSLKAGQEFPPGHYYSAIPDANEAKGIGERSGNRAVCEIAGVDLNWDSQESLFLELAQFYSELPFSEAQSDREPHRYWLDNGIYCYADGVLMYTLLRHLQPARLIEIGSGFSSCLALDVNDLFLDGRMRCTFVEPYPDRLLRNLRSGDAQRVNIVQDKVQNVDPDLFEQLQPNDILFIDSSHVGKAGSDVNFLFFDILPRLKPGVWIHVHDVFYPFEYPEEWILGGRSWNEAYMLHCLLMDNSKYQIRMWGDALGAQKRHLLEKFMPLCLKNTGAGIWLEKMG